MISVLDLFRLADLFIFSAVKFAELCAKPSFRMHLRTESALERVLDLLKDAPIVPVRLVLVYILVYFILF
jgi:hypothetical protein